MIHTRLVLPLKEIMPVLSFTFVQVGVCEKIKAHLNRVFFPSSIKPLSFTFSFIKLNQDFENHKVFL